MIDYIRGEIAELNPTSLTIDCNGIGYIANISLYTYSILNGKETAKIFVHESIREDAYVLFGFAEKDERDLFLLLISVSGVGPSTARIILSSMNAKEIGLIISNGDAKLLQTVKGIGAKTAQRIIVDLKDKIKLEVGSEGITPLKKSLSDIGNQAVSALVMLGFPQPNSQKTVTAILDETPSLTVESTIKEALKRL